MPPVRTEESGPRAAWPADHPEPRERDAPVHLDVPSLRPVLERPVERRPVALDPVRFLELRFQIRARRTDMDTTREPYHERHPLVRGATAVEVAAHAALEVHALPDVDGGAERVLELIHAGSRRQVSGYPLGYGALAPAHVGRESWTRVRGAMFGVCSDQRWGGGTNEASSEHRLRRRVRVAR